MSMIYFGIKPTGQEDRFSCWAACMSWWLNATKRHKRQTQRELISTYDNGFFTNSNGAILPEAVKTRLFPYYGLEMIDVNGDDLPLMLFNDPTPIIYINPFVGALHMNVIFNAHAEAVAGKFGELEIAPGAVCMEPYYPFTAPDFKRTGLYMFRPFSYFTKFSRKVFLGVEKS